MFSIPLSEDDKRILLNKALLIVENLDREEVRPIEIYAVMYLWDRELLRRFGIFDWGSSYRAQDNGVIHQDLQSIIYSDYDLVGEYFEVRHDEGFDWLKASGLVDEDYLSVVEVSVFESRIKPKMADFCEERLRKACTGMAWRKAIRSYGMLINPVDMALEVGANSAIIDKTIDMLVDFEMLDGDYAEELRGPKASAEQEKKLMDYANERLSEEE